MTPTRIPRGRNNKVSILKRRAVFPERPPLSGQMACGGQTQ